MLEQKQQIYGDKLNILINDKNLGFGNVIIIFDNVLKDINLQNDPGIINDIVLYI